MAENMAYKLPSEFYDYMKKTLESDYDEYKSKLESEPYRGLRVNTLKCCDDIIADKLHIKMKQTPFCEHGYYIENSVKGLGNHPFHHAGAFYLQEPSAMSAVTALHVNAGEKVLDLCAAPGGKSTQIAAALNGSGILVANEIIGSRAKILCSNIERLGVKNAVVTNSSPEIICQELAGWFDKVLVDAPCSGEGMIRREPAAVSEWRLENHEMCMERTKHILDNAAQALKSGGYMVYSTCTLSAEENELTIEAFLERHPEFELADISENFGVPAYANLCSTPEIAKARRILFQHGGEGHFVARLRKSDKYEQNCFVDTVNNSDSISVFEEFYHKYFCGNIRNVHRIGDSVYLYPDDMPVLQNTRIVRAGIFAGNIVKNRFDPSHQLYVSHCKSEHKNAIDLDCESDEIRQFLHGDVIACDINGYCAVCVNGITVGFGKASNGQLKNHYPKGLRNLK